MSIRREYRRWIQLLLPALLTTSPSIPQPKVAEAPKLLPNEFWIYRWEQRETGLRVPDRGGRTFTGILKQTVIGQTVFDRQDAYVLRNDDGSSVILSLDLWELGRLDKSGRVEAVFGVKADRQFPLFVGRVYQRQWDNTLVGYSGAFRYTVENVERIRTPAGQFEAFRVQEQGEGTTRDGKPYLEWGISYFAPAAKRFVKQSIETNTGYRLSLELVDYHIEP